MVAHAGICKQKQRSIPQRRSLGYGYTRSMDFLSNDAPSVAHDLIGWQLFVQETDLSFTGGTIIETEAYTAADEASHSFNGLTKRNGVMFGPAGHVYVYFTYGMHWCCNIVTGSDGDGQAVLIRALLPTHNLELMHERRKQQAKSQLTNGPAKLCQALQISGDDNGCIVNDGRILLIPPANDNRRKVLASKRVGIRKNTEVLWRYVLEDVA